YFSSSRYALMTVASLVDNKYFLEECKKYKLPLILGMKMDATAFPKEFLVDVLSYASIIFINESECRCVCDTMNLCDITELFNGTQAKIIVKTRGSKGSTCYYLKDGKVETVDVGIVKAERVIDTVGSGDAYLAGFLYAYFSGMSVEACARYGATLASFILEGMGSTSSAPDEAALKSRYVKNFGGQG
ncbi:MAG TPA: carbohydrate kinase family protein, partial [Bacilli bacterium]